MFGGWLPRSNQLRLQQFNYWGLSCGGNVAHEINKREKCKTKKKKKKIGKQRYEKCLLCSVTFKSFKGYPSHHLSSSSLSVLYREITIFCQPPLLSAHFSFYRLELLSDKAARNTERPTRLQINRDVSVRAGQCSPLPKRGVVCAELVS